MARSMSSSEVVGAPTRARNPRTPHRLSRAALAGLLLASGPVVSGCGVFDDHGGDKHHSKLWKDIDFDKDPNIHQLRPPLPNPEGNRQIDPQGITLHWWGYRGKHGVKSLRDGLAINSACGDTGCSVQYAVLRNGKIIRMMASATEFAYHARGANPTSFGIEIEGTPNDFKMDEKHFNRRQFSAVVALSAELVQDFHLQIDGPATCNSPVGIHGHYEFNKCGTPPGHKIDP
ncbi:N-acetylmuramoyl-L-alanine amidase, partial [Candidatus Saccharibacteria bacterium]|nr:N-acetylmuramoyl-L-alanine amidase [Candidatus Saccharibacteria bacterium]